MYFVKFLIYVVLSTIIIFFVWNILKRMFFTKFYNYFPHQKAQNQQKETSKKKNKKGENNNLNWDAETVDYEEVK